MSGKRRKPERWYLMWREMKRREMGVPPQTGPDGYEYAATTTLALGVFGTALFHSLVPASAASAVALGILTWPGRER